MLPSGPLKRLKGDSGEATMTGAMCRKLDFSTRQPIEKMTL